MGRASPFVLVLVTLGFFFATYNLITVVIHHRYGLPHDDLAMLTNSNAPRYHVALTATDATYSQWQCRIMYYWYKKFKDMPGSGMGEFTRILHSGKSDSLMEEIPTIVVDPLPHGLDRVSFLFSKLYFAAIYTHQHFVAQPCTE